MLCRGLQKRESRDLERLLDEGPRGEQRISHKPNPSLHPERTSRDCTREHGLQVIRAELTVQGHVTAHGQLHLGWCLRAGTKRRNLEGIDMISARPRPLDGGGYLLDQVVQHSHKSARRANGMAVMIAHTKLGKVKDPRKKRGRAGSGIVRYCEGETSIAIDTSPAQNG